MTLYYVDTCIWLNLFKKEGDASKGMPYWKSAQEFIEWTITSQETISYSGFILKELQYILNDKHKFEETREWFNSEFQFLEAHQEDYNLARKFESESGFTLSFYDCIHIALCKRVSAILITRDQGLINFATKYIKVQRPEEFLM